MTGLAAGDVAAAAERLAGHVASTPLLTSRSLDADCGAHVLVKAECLQLTGSFKIRGALNLISQLSAEQLGRGVVAYSTGNHAAAVAAAAHIAGCRAVVVIPSSTPRAKVDLSRSWGAEIVTYDPDTEDREAVADQIVAARGAVLVPPFDHPAIMAGAGTVGLEIASDLAGCDVEPDAVVVSCSGGGLASGVFTALRATYPDVCLHLVEPAGRDKMARSLAAGTPQPATTTAPTILDALSGRNVGTRPLGVLTDLGVQTTTVTDVQAQQAMAAAHRHLKIVLEPGGAAALAGVLVHRDLFAGRVVAVVGSGGNVDPTAYAAAIAETGPRVHDEMSARHSS